MRIDKQGMNFVDWMLRVSGDFNNQKLKEEANHANNISITDALDGMSSAPFLVL